MALFGSVSTLRAQARGWDWSAAVFAYLDDLLRPGSEAHRRLQALAVGKSERIELPGGLFAIEQVYETKARADGFFESHRKYIDVQVVVAGEELMAVTDIARLPVKQGYDGERDVIIYGDYPAASSLRVVAGEAAIFFPVDGHMPSQRIGPVGQVVRKTVIKVPVTADGR
jgi:YhcH/YjgK/YiaL family protein